MEKEQQMKERELKEAHATKERIFKEKVDERMQRIVDEERKVRILGILWAEFCTQGHFAS